jgi:hypothetical protein
MQVVKTFENVTLEAMMTFKEENESVIIGVLPELNDSVDPITLILSKEEAEFLMYKLSCFVCK